VDAQVHPSVEKKALIVDNPRFAECITPVLPAKNDLGGKYLRCTGSDNYYFPCNLNKIYKPVFGGMPERALSFLGDTKHVDQ